ncbi:MAG TPA: type II secretion system protein N [Gammaproteobacteria bacterium]|nr:type II secretion system protein N [Gammaproteobacteria bacterium]
MLTRRSWLALGLGAYVAFAVSSIPASTVYKLFAPPDLRLAGLDGTVWSGGAALGSVGPLSLHDVRWDIAALPLVTGRLSGRVEGRLADGFVETNVSATPSRVVLTGLSASTSVPALGTLLPLKGVEGLVSVALEELRLQNGWPTKAVGKVRVAQLAVPPLMPGTAAGLIALGDYEIVLKEGDGEGIAAEIHDAGGPLEVAGTLTLDPAGNYKLEGVAAARRDAPEELVQGLKLMTGEPDSSGRRPFSLSGSL